MPRRHLKKMHNSFFLPPHEFRLLHSREGFTLIETLISLGLFAIFGFGVYFSYYNLLDLVTKTRVHSIALSTLEREIEIVRNLPFEQVGIQGGFPPGAIPAEKEITVSQIPFTVNAYVRNIDDSFDGTLGGDPNDLAPADYKLVELQIRCVTCANLQPIVLTTNVAPKSLEGTGNSGSLFIDVFHVGGAPVADAEVHVVNTKVTPHIVIDDETNLNGELQLVGVPTSTQGYEITVSKPGYSSDRTYAPGAPENPSPITPHATVASGQVTSISFLIDKVSTLNVRTFSKFCSGVGDIDFNLTGTTLIGRDPDVLKYEANLATDALGTVSIADLETDTYTITNIDTGYDLSGNFSRALAVLNPDTIVNLNWVMEPKTPLAALFTITDASTSLPLDNAHLTLSKGSFSTKVFTKERTASDTDWSGGNYSSQSGRVDAESVPGEIKLQEEDGGYPTSTTEWLVSRTFDFGTSTNFQNFSWTGNLPPAAGSDALKFQVAANNDGATWNFSGPDGTEDTFYTPSSTPLHPVYNSNRFLRYKVFLKTIDSAFTPSLESATLNFSSGCTPDGQAFVNGLGSGTYSLVIEKSGYQTFVDNAVSLTKNWQEYQASISPN